MRKSLVIALVFLISLIPTTTPADDMPHAYFEKVASLAAQYGQYEQWPLAAKQEWIQALHDDGSADVRQETAALLNRDLSKEEQSQMIDTYLVNRYGVGGHLVTVNIYYCLIGELGPDYAWSLEDQVWISQLYLTYFPDQWDRILCALPAEDVITSAAATKIAQEAITNAFRLPDDYDWEQYTVSIMYGVHRRYAAESAPYYTVMFGLVRDGSDPEMQPYAVKYACYVTNEGDVMDTSYFSFTPSPAEQFAAQKND